MNKLKNYYQQRKNAKMEAKGQRYELGDFILKVGSASLAGSFKGIIVEVGWTWNQWAFFFFFCLSTLPAPRLPLFFERHFGENSVFKETCSTTGKRLKHNLYS